jgi:glyoxylase-like metal-dependent hydrolase (beta-lactamase superfamily II)
VQELEPGVWWWEAIHPEWTEEDDPATEGWGPQVSSYALADDDRLLLFDPTTPPDPVAELAHSRDVAIVLTCPWHARDARSLAERYGAAVVSPPPDRPDEDWIAEQIFTAGDRLAIGIEVFPGMERNDLVLWHARRRVLIVGDTLIDRGPGLEFPTEWANKGIPPEEILAALQPLRELPVELVLPTHGAPADRASLERALT